MTSSPSVDTAPARAPLNRDDVPPVLREGSTSPAIPDGVAAAFRAYVAATGRTDVWWLASCHRCGHDFAQPFRSEDERDTWAAEHLTGTGHTVQLTVDGLGDVPDLHLSGIIRIDDDGTFRYLCPAKWGGACERWFGPFSTPQLAIASWRNHPEGKTR